MAQRPIFLHMLYHWRTDIIIGSLHDLLASVLFVFTSATNVAEQRTSPNITCGFRTFVVLLRI